MRESPTGWSTTALSSIAEIGSGAAITRARLGGRYLLMGANGPIGTAKVANFGPGYLVGRVGAAGAVNNVTERCWASDNTLTVVPRHGRADYQFLGHLLTYLRPEDLATKNAQPLVTQTNLGRLAAAVPDSLPEQRLIAEILDTVDEAIRKTEQIIAKLEQVKQGLLNDLLTRGIDDNGQLRDPDRHPEQFKDSELGRIPKEWEVRDLIDLVSLPSGQLNPQIPPYRDWPLIAPDHIESKSGRLLSKETASSQNAISGKYGFDRGDVIYSKIRPYLRKAVLAEFRGLCSADMYPLRANEAINPRFLLAVVLGEHFSAFAESVSMRSGFPKINRQELAEYALPVPPRAEQDQIAMVLDAQDDRSLREKSELTKLRLVKRGLMDDLLTGRVRVTELLQEAAR